MNRIIVTALALITGFFTLVFSLIIAIPLTIAALITGKRIEKRVKKMQKEPRVISHRPGDVADRDNRGLLLGAIAIVQRDCIAALAQTCTQRPTQIKTITAQSGDEAPRRPRIIRHHQAIDQHARFNYFLSGHLCKIFVLQNFAFGNCEPRIKFDFFFLRRRLITLGFEQGFSRA